MKRVRRDVWEFIKDPVAPLGLYLAVWVCVVGLLFPMRPFHFALVWGVVGAVGAVVLLYTGLGIYGVIDLIRFRMKERRQARAGECDA